MKWFRRNVFRQAGQNKGSFLGAVCIIAIGIFIYVSMTDTLWNLRSRMESYYEKNRAADLFACVEGISETELKRLEEIPGIETASGRMAEDLRMLTEDSKEMVTIHLLSFDPEDPLGILTLSASFTSNDELFLGNRMEEVYGYDRGDPVRLLCNGKIVEFDFAGVCYSPDYVYSIPSEGAQIPDGELYDIACIPKARMEKLLQRKDSLNELGFSLSPGYTYEDVRHQLAEQLRPYGLESLQSRKDQVSYDMVSGEMEELFSMGTILPFMFLSISVFMLYVVLKKIIDRDQSLIGTMKAFGLTNRELMEAYFFEGAVIGILGALLGALLSLPFGKYLFEVYISYYNVPEGTYTPYVSVRLFGLLIAVGTSILAVFLGVREILRITPAQAMRAPAPAVTGNFSLPSFLLKRLGPMERMACRSIARNPFRGFLIVLAVAFPFSMASVLFSFRSVANQMYMDQFEKIQTYDFQLTLEGFVSPLRAVQSVEGMDGVQEAEAIYSQAAELRSKNRTELVMITGLNRGSGLWRIMDMYGNYYEPPGAGMILNRRTAEKLHVSKGDYLEVEVSGVTKEPVSIPVAGIISEYFGSGCYMSMDGIAAAFPSPAASNNLLIRTEAGKREEVKQRLMKTSRVTWLIDTKRAVESYQNVMRTMMTTVNMFAVLAVISGGILIYNMSMISIRERMREFGTLRVLGETRLEIGRMLFFEQAIYFLFGILAGIPGSRVIRYLVESILTSDNYEVVLTVSPGAYVTAFLICLAISVLACAAENRFVAGISLTEVLKERE